MSVRSVHSPDRFRCSASGFVRALLLGTLAVGAGPQLGSGQEAFIGRPAFQSGTLMTVTGEAMETDSLLGRVVLFNAWATWCGPCVLEMPSFQRVVDELGDQGFTVLGFSADEESAEFVDAFAKRLGVTYPIFLGPQPPLGLLTSRVRGLPTSILVGRDGRMVRRVEGVFREQDLREAVETLLNEPPPESD
jgi:thiol-disulfide isomerase/thioredoxin